MSTDSSANNGPIEDRFSPFRDSEKDLCGEIALCSDVDKREQLTWKLATFYLETARPEKAIAPLKWIVETAQSEESKQDSLRALQFFPDPRRMRFPHRTTVLIFPTCSGRWQMLFSGRGINNQVSCAC